MSGKRLVITIDGPVGSGKSTVSRMLAKRLGFRYLETGILYRSIAYMLIINGRKNLSPEDLKKFISSLKFEFSKGGRIKVNGIEMDDRLYTEGISMEASRLSAIPEVRQSLLAVQRQAAEKDCIVAEGRDTGSVIFPKADFKFYLDASEEERAKRRYLQLKSRGKSPDYEEVLSDLKKRDYADRNRNVAPLKVPDGAVVIDSTNLTAEQVVDLICGHIENLIKRKDN